MLFGARQCNAKDRYSKRAILFYFIQLKYDILPFGGRYILMNLRKFKHDPADLLRQGEEIAAARNIDPRYKFRVVAVNMVLSGRNTVAQAAKLVGVSRMSVNGWVRTADQEGSCLAERQKARRQKAPLVSRSEAGAPRRFAEASP